MKRKQKLVDLQVHSIHSDGSLTPSELFRMAKKSGVKILVVCDHDSAIGMHDVEKKAKQYGFPFISGIEITVTFKGEELHLLGYGFDYHHIAMKRASQFYINSRVTRIKKMIINLNRLGYAVSYIGVRNRAEKIIGRPHLADQVIFDKRNNKILIKNFGFIPDRSQFIAKYLVKSAAAYAEKKNLSAGQAIKLIHDAGGYAFISHPLGRRYSPDLSLWPVKGTWSKNLLALKKMGLDGIEAYASDHYVKDIKNLLKFAERNNLQITGGSDFHNKSIPGLPLGYISKNRTVPYSVGERLLKLLNK
ncbi:MAG: PHP domain-containing protein [Patescibacteria group bacterium]